MAANGAPDWEWWKHVPNVTLREAVALSLNLDPTHSWLLRGREFERRQSLATRCLGESLDGPLNWPAVAIEGDEPVVRLQAFASWALGIGLDLPEAFSELAHDTGQARRTLKTAVGADSDDTEPTQNRSELFMPTGGPGRPSKGMHMIRIEFYRRRQANECKPTLREEASDLEEWFRRSYPTAQPVKRKTIENNIRSDYRTWATINGS
jgi:hypothetical protein